MSWRRLRSFSSFLLPRVVISIVLIILVIIMAFVLIHIVPGDVIYVFIGDAPVSDEYIQNLRRSFGLDQPLPVQLYIYLSKAIRGDLGYSFVYNRPIMEIILQKAPNTVLLMGAGYLFSLFGLILGIVASRKQNSLTDNVITTLSSVWYSLPVFWLGQILIIVLSINFKLFPSGGMYDVRLNSSSDIVRIMDVLHHLFLPALCVGMFQLTVVTRMTRASMLEILKEDYITTARANGLRNNAIYFKHALRNAILPVVTIMGMNIGTLFGGAVLTETVFAWPGLGRLCYDALLQRDYNLLMGMFISISVVITIVNFMTDILYSYIDPRIRYRHKL